MPFKSALQLFIDPVLEKPLDRKLSKIDSEAREEYVRLVSGAYKSVKIVAGEANSRLFDREDFATGLETFLKNNPDAILQLIFHKNNDAKVAEALFKDKNKLLFALKQKFNDRVHIFWINKRPHQHYAVIDDGMSAILEEPDHPKYKPFDALVTYDKSWAHKWSERFDKYLDHCRDSGRCRELKLTT